MRFSVRLEFSPWSKFTGSEALSHTDFLINNSLHWLHSKQVLRRPLTKGRSCFDKYGRPKCQSFLIRNWWSNLLCCVHNEPTNHIVPCQTVKCTNLFVLVWSAGLGPPKRQQAKYRLPHRTFLFSLSWLVSSVLFPSKNIIWSATVDCSLSSSLVFCVDFTRRSTIGQQFVFCRCWSASSQLRR